MYPTHSDVRSLSIAIPPAQIIGPTPVSGEAHATRTPAAPPHVITPLMFPTRLHAEVSGVNCVVCSWLVLKLSLQSTETVVSICGLARHGLKELRY